MTGTKKELLRGLDERQISSLVALGTRVRLAAGDVLFRLGDDAEWLYSIEWGRISLTLPMNVRGRDEEILVEERLPGQMLGWSALIPPYRMTLTASAVTETELLAIPRDPLLEFLDTHPPEGYGVMRNVAAIVSQRLHVFQTMWLREMQRSVRLSHA